MGHVDFAAAIVKQAMADYKKALRNNDERTSKECERFFLSKWGQTLSLHNGERIIRLCKEEVKAKEKKGDPNG